MGVHERQRRKPHAIMISVPYQGHINPFVSLALKLASNGFTVTFAHLEFVHHKLSIAHRQGNCTGEDLPELDFFSGARESGLDVRYATISDGVPLEFDRYANLEEYWATILREFGGHVDKFVGKMVESEPEGVYFLVADSIYVWPAAIADKYGLVNVSFWTEPALVFALLKHRDLLEAHGHLPCKEDVDEEINYIPGVKPLSTKDSVVYFRESEAAGIVSVSTRLSFEGVKKADFVLHNTVHELESDTLSALNKSQPNYAIGPLNFSKNIVTNNVTKSLLPESDCTQWLATKPPGSVLYVSFGSMAKISKPVIEEIGHGLLLSEVSFIWVVRHADTLPGGFRDKIDGRGLIVPWCDQIRVLSDPAVGGFLTHTGWNSTVESIWCGVPMICYPIYFEQPTNRKLVVDDWRIGINLCDGGSVERNEVAQKIKGFMSEDVYGSLREEAEKMKTILRNALEINGSSERNFDQFVKDLEAKIYAKSGKV